MPKRVKRGELESLVPNPQPDSVFKYEEREREGFVQSDADLEYGQISGFRYGITSTGMRHKETALGRLARDNER